MNLYFLSLLIPTRKRTKNLALKYEVQKEYEGLNIFEPYINQPKVNAYLKMRFPFLKVGDMIGLVEYKNVIRLWNGNNLEIHSDLIQDYVSHPFSYGNLVNFEVKRLSPSIIDQISKTEKRKYIGNHKINHLLISRFKIGKQKYEIVYLLHDSDMTKEDLVDLKEIMKDEYFYLRITLDEEEEIEIGDYFERFNKRLFLYFS
jgi:hypothetical protein